MNKEEETMTTMRRQVKSTRNADFDYSTNERYRKKKNRGEDSIIVGRTNCTKNKREVAPVNTGISNKDDSDQNSGCT